jgi:hypothetical protein
MPSINNRRLIALLTPSWLSGLVVITAGLVVVIGTVIVFSIHTSTLGKELLSYLNKPSSQPVLTLPGQMPLSSNSDSLQNTWPLIAFWALIGLVTYFVVESVFKVLNSAVEFYNELSFVHLDRQKLLKSTLQILIIRLTVILIWFIFANFFFKQIVPLSLSQAHDCFLNIRNYHGALDALAAFSVVVASLHLQVIFLRFSFGRPRLFSSALYLDA